MMLVFKVKKAICAVFCTIVAAPIAFSYTANEPEGESALKLKTVVLDAGHGGKDPGAPGQTSSTSEKHIVLSIAKKLGSRIVQAYPDVKVVYTRDKDVFVELNQRANIAKKNKADLFISIHCNSNSSKSPYGASVHILGQNSSNQSNKGDYFDKSMSVARRENAVMLLEDDYKTKYQGFDPDSPESVISHSLMWSANYESSLMLAAEMDAQFHEPPFRKSNYTGIHQDVFYLLWATNMPSVLLELGFLSNPTDFKYLSTESGQNQVADKLFNAFNNYKSYYEGSMDFEQNADIRPAPAVDSVPESYFAIQIMGLGRALEASDPAFKGLEVKAVKSSDSSVYKYVTAWSEDRTAVLSALDKVKVKFPEAFIVKVTGDNVKRDQ